MRDYLFNNKKISKEEWKKAFQDNPEATVIIRTPSKAPVYEKPIPARIISPEKAKQLRNNYKI